MASLDRFRAPTRSLTAQLRRVPLFAALPSDHRGCLQALRDGVLFDLPAGIEIVSPGDPPALLVVTEGTLAVGGGPQVWSAGGYLGVTECLARISFAQSIRTVAPTVLYRLDGALFGTLLTCCPAIAASLRTDLATQTPFAATASI